MTFHLKGTTKADLPALATPITDAAERHKVLERICDNLGEPELLEARVAESPLIRVHLEGG